MSSGQMEELSFGGIENHKILFTPITQLEMRARSEVSWAKASIRAAPPPAG